MEPVPKDSPDVKRLALAASILSQALAIPIQEAALRLAGTAMGRDELHSGDLLPAEPGPKPPSERPAAQLDLLSGAVPRRRRYFLTAREAARRLGMSVRWLYQHQLDFPFTRRFGRRSVRFDAAELELWLEGRKLVALTRRAGH